MEKYQNVSILMGIVGIILGQISRSVIGGLGLWIILVSFIGIVLPLVLVNTKHHEKVGIILIIIGIVGNLLLVIPGIMAIRYKPESKSDINPSKKEVEK